MCGGCAVGCVVGWGSVGWDCDGVWGGVGVVGWRVLECVWWYE